MSDVAIPNTTEVATTVNLDLYADLVKEEMFLKETVKEWETRLKAVQARIQDVMGDAEVATFAGRDLYTRRFIDQIREADLKRELPTLYEAYCRDETVRKFDRDLFKQAQPEVYRKYQSRPFKRA